MTEERGVNALRLGHDLAGLPPKGVQYLSSAGPRKLLQGVAKAFKLTEVRFIQFQETGTTITSMDVGPICLFCKSMILTHSHPDGRRAHLSV